MAEWERVLDALEKGEARAARKRGAAWEPDIDVKKAILAAFREGTNVDQSDRGWPGFVDKDTMPTRRFGPEQRVRLVPGGSAIRRGAYIAPGVIVMPPAYVNVGAYVDSGTMIDSHCLVGSCAQIGKNVHLSAGVQIGGVLEPVGLSPVVVEDGCFVGAGAVLVEGIQLSAGAVVAPGTVLSKSVPVYDAVRETRLEAGEPIPPNAVVVPGTRPAGKTRPWAASLGLSLHCAVVVKYRDKRSDASLALEESLR